jgi:hypothetical protein
VRRDGTEGEDKGISGRRKDARISNRRGGKVASGAKAIRGEEGRGRDEDRAGKQKDERDVKRRRRGQIEKAGCTCVAVDELEHQPGIRQIRGAVGERRIPVRRREDTRLALLVNDLACMVRVAADCECALAHREILRRLTSRAREQLLRELVVGHHVFIAKLPEHRCSLRIRNLRHGHRMPTYEARRSLSAPL